MPAAGIVFIGNDGDDLSERPVVYLPSAASMQQRLNQRSDPALAIQQTAIGSGTTAESHMNALILSRQNVSGRPLRNGGLPGVGECLDLRTVRLRTDRMQRGSDA